MNLRKYKPGHSPFSNHLYNHFRSVFFKSHGPKNISEALKQVVDKHPLKDAVVCDGVRLTFNQLREQETKVAGGLINLGVKKGDWVAIMLPNCIEFVISFLAFAKIGAIVVPVDIYYERPELEKLLSEAHVTTVVTSSEFIDIVEACIKNSPDFKNLILKEPNYKSYPSLRNLMKTQKEVERIFPKIKVQDDLLYLYTSGTTGMPKGVLLKHEKVIAMGKAWRQRFSITEDDKCLTLAPLFRSPALISVLVAGIFYGITMVIPSNFQPQTVWQQIDSEKISFFHANPFHFAALANMPGNKNSKLPGLKLCYSSGNRLGPKVKKSFLDNFGIRIEERYGTLEVGGICRNGYPLRGVQVKLIDESGRMIKFKDRIGEIVVKTPMMVQGYHNLPEESSKAFKNGWFHTGDIGKIDRNGKLHILYRKKTSVLIDKKEVYPDEVESVLRKHPNVKEVMVLKYKKNQEGLGLKAIIVFQESCSKNELLKFCKSRLDHHKIPDFIEFRNELPRSWKAVVSGKNQAYPKWGES